MRKALSIALLLSMCQLGHAAESYATELAKAHFELGSIRYKEGDFQAALRHFRRGYAVSSLPRFLINIGQTYVQLDQVKQATAAFTRYLSSSDTNSGLKAKIHEVLTALTNPDEALDLSAGGELRVPDWGSMRSENPQVCDNEDLRCPTWTHEPLNRATRRIR